MANRMINNLYHSMPWNKIDTVVFDIGNVLVAMDEHKVLESMFPDSELRREIYLHTIRSPYWNMLDGGYFDIKECIQAMSEGESKLLEPIRRFMTGWPDYRYVVEEGHEAVLTCKRHGKKLYILSNYYGEYYDRNVREYDFFHLFDGAVISSRVHMLKPRLDIYCYLTDTFHVDPARTLFIDDAAANIEAAFAAGWHGFCYNASGLLRAFMGD